MQRIAALQLRNLVTPDWVTFALLSATLLVVIRSVEAAGWAVHPPLSMTVLLAAFTGLLAARLPWRAWQRHLAGAAMGLLVVYLQTASLVEAEGLARQFAQLNDRLAAWWSAATGDGVNPDPLPFSLLLTVVAWAAGYLAAWVVFQSGNIWLAILPASLGLVTNLTYLPPSYVGYLFPFLLVTMLLLVRLTALQRRASLGRSEIGYPSSLPHLSLGAAFVLSSLIVFAVALLPDHSFRVEPLRRVWNASRQPAEWVQEQFTRLFPGITGIKPSSASPFGAVFALIANAPTSEDTVFAANAPFATYWRVRSYSTYTAGGWSTGQTTIQPALQLGVDLDLEISDDPGTYYYEIQTHVPAPYLFLPSATPLSVNIPARLETLAKNEELAAMVAVRPQNPLEPKETYNGLFTLALPPEQLLREPTTEYPDWVLRQYLQLPSSLPSRVRNEAASLTRGLDRSYDKAVAIEAFLREKLTYTANAPPAPAGADPIEHFLFEAREGHGGHFASAMTVMLRSLGIPTRLVSGYGPGVPDEDEGVYLIRQKDRHYWPEAYFPNFGWVEFEPTPIYVPRPRAMDDLTRLTLRPGDAMSDAPEGLDSLLPEEDDDLLSNQGGRLPGGFGLRPFPLVHTGSPVGFSGLLLVAAVLAWALLVWAVYRRYAMTLPRPELAYHRLCRLADTIGTGPKPTQTPQEFARSLGSLAPDVSAEIRLICDTFGSMQYGRKELSRRESFQLRVTWRKVVRAVMKQSFR